MIEILRGYAPRAASLEPQAASDAVKVSTDIKAAEPEIIALLRSEEYQLREDRRTLHFGLEETEDEEVRTKKS